MKNRIVIPALLAIVFTTIALWFFPIKRSSHQKLVGNSTPQPSQTVYGGSSLSHSMPTQPSSELSTPPPEWADKTVAMRQIWANENSKPQDFYGRVIDQYGHPVRSAHIDGNLAWIKGYDVPEEKKIIRVQTDANGEFQFTGIAGWELGVVPSKQGYALARNNGAISFPPEGRTSPARRAVFTLWKLKGAEPMIYRKINAGLSCDGKPMTLDLLTGHRVSSGGDLTISFVRKPENIDRSKSFDWSLTLDVPEGGLLITKDIYQNEAPPDGYQPSIVENGQAGPPHFTGNQFDQCYYLKSRSGRVYGRIQLHIRTDYQPPPTAFQIDVYANPSGSRNLEYDPSIGEPALP